MNYHDAYPSKYLKQSDFEAGKNLVLTISTWAMEDIGQDDDKESKLTLHFKELEKSWTVNLSNADTIGGLYGEDLDKWVGKRIALYVDPKVMFGGKRVGGIRVRDEVPAGRGAPPQQRAATQGGAWTLADAIAAAEEVGIMKDDLRKILHEAGYKGWSPSLTAWLQKIIADQAPPADIDDQEIPF